MPQYQNFLLIVIDSLHWAAYRGQPSILILLDRSADFSPSDRNIFLQRLHTYIGRMALNWFRFYISGLSPSVFSDGAYSKVYICLYL